MGNSLPYGLVKDKKKVYLKINNESFFMTIRYIAFKWSLNIENLND